MNAVLRDAQVITEEAAEEMYWQNLYDLCVEERRISYPEFRANPWRWLGAFGRGEVGAEFLPLLPEQARIRARLDS
jgi:hypothetical protein